MITLTQDNPRRSVDEIERSRAMFQSWCASLAFLGTACCVVCVGVAVYSLGPVLGLAVTALGLLWWSAVRNSVTASDAQGGAEAEDRIS